jgi:3-oxoacyl-[acyl-carrier protein] reductase
MKMEGEVVWITGAARGLGLAIAKAFAQEGASVAVNDLRPLEEAEAKIREKGRFILAMQGDVTNAQQVQEMAERIHKQFGRIDILVNNAGGMPIGAPSYIVDMKEEDWDIVINVNLKGTFLCCRAVIPYMRKQGTGKIVNISSFAGRTALPGSGPAYSGAKAGILGLTRHLAKTEGAYGIRVNAVSPGTIMTEQMAERFKNYPKEELEKRVSDSALKRFGKPEEVAAAVLFLSSEESSFITGANIDVNGGRFMQM